MRKLLTGLLLSFVLLLTQQGAMLHELGHVTALQTQPDGDHTQSSGAVLCAACLAFSQAGTAAAPQARAALLLTGLAYADVPAVHPSVSTTDAPRPRSRGPPTVL